MNCPTCGASMTLAWTHPHVLHVYEIKDANLVGQWRFERRGDQPS